MSEGRSETARIAQLLEQAFEGTPYYGLSVLGALERVTADIASQRPAWSVHTVWELVTHVIAELDYARAVIEGTAGPWIAGETTWPPINDSSDAAWQETLDNLRRAQRDLVALVSTLEDAVLEVTPIRVQGPFYVMLHGTLQHHIYHAGQIALLTRHLASAHSKSP